MVSILCHEIIIPAKDAIRLSVAEKMLLSQYHSRYLQKQAVAQGYVPQPSRTLFPPPVSVLLQYQSRFIYYKEH